jgi:hypothetical protein
MRSAIQLKRQPADWSHFKSRVFPPRLPGWTMQAATAPEFACSDFSCSHDSAIPRGPMEVRC